MNKSISIAAVAALVVSTMVWAAVRLNLPFGQPPGADVYAYEKYLYIRAGDCSGDERDMPAGYNCAGEWKYTDYREPAGVTPTYDPQVANNPQEFFGVRGASTNRAWEVTTGRPDVLISVFDSGIRWHNSGGDQFKTVNKTFLNRRELPLPKAGANPNDTRFGGYDVNADGIFNVQDYIGDGVPDVNGNGYIDAQDLIHRYSNGVDEDNNGYIDDISGWDFFEDDNDAEDDAEYDHGSGEAEDSSAEIGRDMNGQCPNCMVMHMRVGSSFVADVNHFAEGVIYAVDMGTQVVQSALGALNHTSFGQYALDYAYEKGVISNTSEADEAAGHHNWPSAYDHTMVFNSIREVSLPTTRPHSYLVFNGCTNFGGYTYMSIPSVSCSSEATGRSAGISGLLQSAARNAVTRGEMGNYVRDNGSRASYPLSSLEAVQLWRLSGDDIDFSSPCPGPHAFCNQAPAGTTAMAPPNNFVLTTSAVPSDRYQVVKGWDYFSGYGRANNGRLVRYIGRQGVSGFTDKIEGPAALKAEDRIPPEADIVSPRWWKQYPVKADNTLLAPEDAGAPGMIIITGHAAANRVTAAGGSFDYILEYAPHAQGLDYVKAGTLGSAAVGSAELSNGPWTTIKRVNNLSAAYNGELGRVSASALRAALAAAVNPFDVGSDPTSQYLAEKNAIRLRLRVIAHPVNVADTINNEAVFQKQIDVYPAVETVIRDDLGVARKPTGGAGSPSWHDIDGDGKDELIMPTEDGLIHAYTDVKAGIELAGWPVKSLPDTSIRHMTSGNNPYTRGEVPAISSSPFLLGSPAVADLDNDGINEVIHGDLSGRVYAWQPDGSLKPGWPVTVNYNYSRQPECTGLTIPACDDFSSPKRRDRFNNRDWGINSPPVVGDLDKTKPGLEVVFGANDGHLYAVHADGTPVAGWPVFLRDPGKVATMDPVSHFVTYVAGAGQHYGTEVLVTPALADLNRDGTLEVVAAVNEQYTETPNAALDPGVTALGNSGLAEPGNTRLYLLYADGSNHPATPAQNATAHSQDQAYWPGWPVRQAILLTELLPYVGAGSNGQPVVGNFDTDTDLEIFSASSAGPGYLWNLDGTPAYGSANGTARTLAVSGGTATDTPVYIGVGGFAAGSLDGGVHLSLVGPGAGLKRLLDIALEGRQLGAEDYLSIWDSRTGEFEPYAPFIVNDLQFLSQPAIFDTNGDGLAEVIQGTAVSDTVIASATSTNNTATRLHQGGWNISTAGIGSGAVAGSNLLHYATFNREGWLRVYPTSIVEGTAAACTARSQWPEYGHDAHRSGDYGHDGERPYPLKELSASVGADKKVTLSFKATGDDRSCGRATSYELRSQPGRVVTPNWLAATPVMTAAVGKDAGAADSLQTAPFGFGVYTLLLRAFDDVGNGSAVSSVVVVLNSPAPAAFSFIERTNVPTSTFITSELVRLSGFVDTLPIRISVGSSAQYSINGGPFTNAAGQVPEGATIAVRHISSAAGNTATESGLTIGTFTAVFRSVTTAQDRVPDAFSFGSKTGQAAGVKVESITVTLTGFDAPIAFVAGPGLEYRIGVGEYTSSGGSLLPGQSLTVRHMTNAARLGYTKSYLRAGGVTGYFVTRTQ